MTVNIASDKDQSFEFIFFVPQQFIFMFKLTQTYFVKNILIYLT